MRTDKIEEILMAFISDWESCETNTNADLLLSMVDDAAKEISELDEWVSVEDRLPAHSTKVIINHITSYGRDEAFGCYHEDTERFVYWGGDFENSLEVTHWQPLPQPPKQK